MPVFVGAEIQVIRDSVRFALETVHQVQTRPELLQRMVHHWRETHGLSFVGVWRVQSGSLVLDACTASPAAARKISYLPVRQFAWLGSALRLATPYIANASLALAGAGERFLVVPLLRCGRVDRVLLGALPDGRAGLSPAELDLVQIAADTLSLSIERVEREQELFSRTVGLRNARDEAIEVLARALETRDCETGEHTQRVTLYSSLLGCIMGLSEEELEELGLGATLHDIGKIGIPDAILLKNGPLSPDEWRIMRRHPVIGTDMLSERLTLISAEPVVRWHHEWYNGRGYPDGLSGTDVPQFARIFAIADAFDAMTSDRPYRKALPMETAIAAIVDGAGQQFCPQCVEAFLAIPRDALHSVRMLDGKEVKQSHVV